MKEKKEKPKVNRFINFERMEKWKLDLVEPSQDISNADFMVSPVDE